MKVQHITMELQHPGQIRVGRIVYNGPDGPIYPQREGFTPIIVLTKSSEYGDLGPYELRDEEGRIMENLWQFSKVYQEVPEVAIPYAVKYPKIVWRWPAEVHIGPDNIPNEAYWHWRDCGQRNNAAVRYPVGRANMDKCLYALKNRDGPQLNYIESRKQIYAPLYIELVRTRPLFAMLKARLEAGENLLIIEVDGPHEESLNYYRAQYRVGDDFIEDNTMLATPDNLRIMRDDDKHPFGHGYCLAMALTNLDPNFD